MVRCWRIQVPSFGQPGRTDRHPEDAGGLLVIASCPDVGVGQFGAHDWITPAGLLGPCPTCPSCGSSFQSSRSAVWVTLHSPVRAHAREVPGAMMYLVELFPAGTTWPSGSLGHAAAVFATTATDRVRSTGDRLEQEAMSFK